MDSISGPQTVCPNLGVQGGGTSCAECRPMQIPGMDQNLVSCDVRWNGMLLILTLGCFSPPWRRGKRWSLKEVGLLYCYCGSLEWVGEHPKSQCVGFDKAMYSNLGCPRGVDAWVRWRFVALVQAKKICDALAPWVLRDIEALNTVWALTFQRSGLLRLPNVQQKNHSQHFMLCPSSFSTTHTIPNLFLLRKKHPQYPKQNWAVCLGNKRIRKFLGTAGVYINPIALPHRSDARRSGGQTQ